MRTILEAKYSGGKIPDFMIKPEPGPLRDSSTEPLHNFQDVSLHIIMTIPSSSAVVVQCC